MGVYIIQDAYRRLQELQAAHDSRVRAALNEQQAAVFWRNVAVAGSVAAGIVPAFRWIKLLVGR